MTSFGWNAEYVARRRAEKRLFEISIALGPERCREIALDLRRRAIRDEAYTTLRDGQIDAANALLAQALFYENAQEPTV